MLELLGIMASGFFFGVSLFLLCMIIVAKIGPLLKRQIKYRIKKTVRGSGLTAYYPEFRINSDWVGLPKTVYPFYCGTLERAEELIAIDKQNRIVKTEYIKVK